MLLIGSGLTALDVAVALRHHGHRGRVTAISRHGRVPQRHAPYTPRGALRWIRREAAAHDWRAVIDSLRPHTQAVWRGWTLAWRASFLRHARNLWDVHRHRAAPEVAVDLEVVRGRILSLSAGIEVHTDRGTLHAARVFNCTGPASDYARIDLPLVMQLRRAGLLTPDPLRLDVETADDGRLLGADGQPVDGLYTLGPLRRPALWESTAIPEIRAQAAALSGVRQR
ncbi:MAG TPA: hypothetical protein VEO54_20995 [Thermoanaerobaculia bacterium]|nr:hypothetical protein [Thermoanaerobaculia bacterium]